MARMIDADALYEKTAEWEAQALHMVEKTMNDEDATEWKRWSTILTERSAFKFDVADAPTVDAVPVVHGSWQERIVDDECDKYGFFRRRFYCSACGDWNTHGASKYCPHCGARMDGCVNDA